MKYILILITFLGFANLSNASEKSDFEDVALYISGYQSPQDHQEEMDKLWNAYENKTLKYLKEWQASEIANLHFTKDCNVFYPFSGPDVVHMITLFPTCQKYIMVGLEPTGQVENFKKENIDLVSLREGIYSLLDRSFFVTKEMQKSFRSEKNGVFVPIVAFLKRMNMQIVNIEKISLSESGQIAYDAKIGNGIKITFKHAGSYSNQEIYYIRKQLTSSNNGIDQFLKDQKPLITYLKAAQYALFDSRFAVIRNAILDNSKLVLQDDSGLPYRYFNNKNWQVTFYGNYEGPYSESFRGYKQNDLMDAYRKSALKEMPFRLGYGYRKINTILIKALKSENSFH